MVVTMDVVIVTKGDRLATAATNSSGVYFPKTPIQFVFINVIFIANRCESSNKQN